MNIVEAQNRLKDLSDQQLASQLQTGAVPAYLVIAEFDRRKRARKAGAPAQPPMTTVADDAMESGIAQLPMEGMPQAYAGGGIVSFQGGGEIEREKNLTDYIRMLGRGVRENILEPVGEWWDRGDSFGYGQGMAGSASPAQKRIATRPTPAEMARQDAGRTARVAQIPVDTPETMAQMGVRPPPPSGSRENPTQLPPVTATAAPINDPAPTDPPSAPARRAGPAAPQGIAALTGDGVKMPIAIPEERTSATEAYAKKLSESMEGRSKDNLNQALMQAGFAMMAGNSTNAFENIGKGALVGLQAYAEGKKDIDDLQRDIAKLEMEAEKAANDRDWRVYNAKMSELNTLRGLDMEAKKLDAAQRRTETSANAQTSATQDAKVLTQIRGYEGILEDYATRISQTLDPAEKQQLQAEMNRVKGVLATLYGSIGMDASMMAPPAVGLPAGAKVERVD